MLQFNEAYFIVPREDCVADLPYQKPKLTRSLKNSLKVDSRDTVFVIRWRQVEWGNKLTGPSIRELLQGYCLQVDIESSCNAQDDVRGNQCCFGRTSELDQHVSPGGCVVRVSIITNRARDMPNGAAAAASHKT